MNSIPTIVIQAPSQFTNGQTTSGNNPSAFAEIRIVLMLGSSTATNCQDAAVCQVPLVFQLPMQKQVKRSGKKKSKPKSKRKQQQQNGRQRKTMETNQMETETTSPLQDVAQRPNTGTSDHSGLLELIQQHESTDRRITTGDIRSTASKAVQVSGIDTPAPDDIETTSDDAFWNSIDNDIDRMITECTHEELEAIMNRSPLSDHDLLDELLA